MNYQITVRQGNDTKWLTYFNPESKLKWQAAGNPYTTGVIYFTDLESAEKMAREVADFTGLKVSITVAGCDGWEFVKKNV